MLEKTLKSALTYVNNEILGVLPEDDFKLTLENEQGSALIQQDADASTQYVVMPIRI